MNVNLKKNSENWKDEKKNRQNKSKKNYQKQIQNLVLKKNF